MEGLGVNGTRLFEIRQFEACQTKGKRRIRD